VRSSTGPVSTTSRAVVIARPTSQPREVARLNATSRVRLSTTASPGTNDSDVSPPSANGQNDRLSSSP
jgi:hypothetical protein